MVKKLIAVKMSHIFSNMFKRQNKESKAMKILMPFLIVYVLAAFSFLIGTYGKMMAAPFASIGLSWLYFAIFALMAIIFCFLGSIIMAQAQLFDSKDNEMLLAMPLKPSHILASRMASILVLNYIYTAIIMVPSFVVFAMDVGVTGLQIAMFIGVFLVLPLFSLALSSLGGLALSFITPRFKRSSLIVVLLSVGFIVGYMYVMSNLQEYMMTLLANGQAIASAIKGALPPAYWAGEAIMGSPLNLLFFALFSIVPFGLVYALISKSYIKIITTKKGHAKEKYTRREMKAEGVFSALLKREAKRFFSLPVYLLNAGIGAIMHVLLGVVLLIKKDALELIFGQFGSGSALAPAFGVIAIVFCTMMVMPTASSISLEGKNLWIVRSAPIGSIQILNAKIALSLLCGIPTGIFAAICVAIAFPSGPVMTAALILLPITFGAFVSVFGLFSNLVFPKLDWISEVYAIKQGAATMLAMFGNMGIMLALGLLYGLLLNRYVDLDVYILIVSVLFALAAFGVYGWIKKTGVKRFESL